MLKEIFGGTQLIFVTTLYWQTLVQILFMDLPDSAGLSWTSRKMKKKTFQLKVWWWGTLSAGHGWSPPTTVKMSFIFEGDLDALKLNRFQPNFKLSLPRAYADHPKTSKTPAPFRNVHNHFRLQQQLQQCHWSLRVILMPSNSTYFN